MLFSATFHHLLATRACLSSLPILQKNLSPSFPHLAPQLTYQFTSSFEILKLPNLVTCPDTDTYLSSKTYTMSAAEYYQQGPPQQSYASPHPPPQAYPQYPQPVSQPCSGTAGRQLPALRWDAYADEVYHSPTEGLHHNKGTIHRRGRCSISNRHPRRRAAVAVVVLRAV